MENIKKYAPLVLLAAYTIKSVVKGAEIPDSFIIAVLASLVGISRYLDQIKHTSAIQAQLDKQSARITKLTETLANQDQEIKEAKNYVSSIKLQNTLRPKTG